MEPINKDAKYILFKNGYQGRPTLIDINDIKEITFLTEADILKHQDNIYNYYDQENIHQKVKIYKIVFTDDSIWQIELDDDTISRYNELKKEIDK